MSTNKPRRQERLSRWPEDLEGLERLHVQLAQLEPEPWYPSNDVAIGGCFVCFGRGDTGPGALGDRGWAAAAVLKGRRIVAGSEWEGEAGAPYLPGFLAAREGLLLEGAVRALPRPPDVLLVNATGLDHPRRAGLAVQLGWALELPTVGVTHRPFVADGEQPLGVSGASSPLWIDADHVGWLVRTRSQVLPLAVSPGWRLDLDTALEIVLRSVGRARTPEPIRQARRLARTARGRGGSRTPVPGHS